MNLLRAIEASNLSVWVRESGSIWSYPTIIFFHSVGLAIIVGLSTAIDLRVLGFAPGVPVAPLEKLFPIMWIGFWVNAVSGLFLAMADAPAMVTSWLFLLKMAIIGLAVVTMASLKRELFSPTTSGDVLSRAAKARSAQPHESAARRPAASPPPVVPAGARPLERAERGLFRTGWEKLPVGAWTEAH